MIIGRFEKTSDGYRGYIRTLNIEIPTVSIVEKTKGPGSTEKSPDFVVLAGRKGHGIEIGAAWFKESANGAYLSVQIDDPSWPESINCALIGWLPRETFDLIWSRYRPPAASARGDENYRNRERSCD